MSSRSRCTLRPTSGPRHEPEETIRRARRTLADPWRRSLFVKARKTEYKSSGRNIFIREIPRPPQPKIPVADPKIPIVPPTPVTPTVTPLPVKFFGYGTIPNGTARVAFFTDGEDVYVVAEGEVLLKRFRILRIGNANLEYEEVSSGLRGTANLEEQGAPPSA